MTEIDESANGRTVRQRMGGRSARVRKAVFAATLSLVAEGGLDQLSVAEVAARACVHETSIYRRWKAKDALLVAAILDRSAEAMPIPDSGSVRTDLVTLVRGALAFLRSPLGNAVIRTTVSMPASGEANEIRRSFWSRRFPEALVIFARGAARGEIADGVDHRLVLQLLMGLLHVHVFVINDPNDAGLPERLVDLVLNGAAHPPRVSA
jgi:AcrR family transcriptional regulator